MRFFEKDSSAGKDGAGVSVQNVWVNGGKSWVVLYDFGYARRGPYLHESEER